MKRQFTRFRRESVSISCVSFTSQSSSHATALRVLQVDVGDEVIVVGQREAIQRAEKVGGDLKAVLVLRNGDGHSDGTFQFRRARSTNDLSGDEQLSGAELRDDRRSGQAAAFIGTAAIVDGERSQPVARDAMRCAAALRRLQVHIGDVLTIAVERESVVRTEEARGDLIAALFLRDGKYDDNTGRAVQLRVARRTSDVRGDGELHIANLGDGHLLGQAAAFGLVAAVVDRERTEPIRCISWSTCGRKNARSDDQNSEIMHFA